MLLSDTVKSLLQNEKGLCRSAINTLLKIANNIINHPKEEKYRKINLNSDVTEKVLLPAIGALETLFVMGFEEETERLIFPENGSLDNLTLYRDQLEKLKRDNIAEEPSNATVSKSTTPKRKSGTTLSDAALAQYIASESEMRKELEHQFQQVLIFETPHLQEAARDAMPHKELTKKAKEREKSLMADQEDKKVPLNFQDCILIELLQWFKEDFFSWFDHGYCDSCSKSMKFIGHVSPNDEESMYGGHRVEKYECESCQNSVRFPRYFHPGKLLQTRKGRCMEWASSFTLMCRALGLDSRYVWDKTDHVWTEAFSLSQNRWIHADPCENKLDCPLIYENGWGKKLSYIFAFSKDEIVDCVWRYSAKHKEVCTRRTRCREEVLALMLCNMNKERQKNFPDPENKFLEVRLVREIVDFFSIPKSNKKGENEGRLSGSLSWRLARGETEAPGGDPFTPYTFILTEEEAKNKEMIVKYSPGQDSYIREGSRENKFKGWKSGVFHSKNVFRKHEKDWKMVYIARTEGATKGELKWRFEWTSKDVKICSIMIAFQHKTYENGDVIWQVCSGDACFPGNQSGVLQIPGEDLAENCSSIELSATLVGGNGDVAWQHAQLFRQSEKDKKFPFFVKISFS